LGAAAADSEEPVVNLLRGNFRCFYPLQKELYDRFPTSSLKIFAVVIASPVTKMPEISAQAISCPAGQELKIIKYSSY
jgi:hypothetical protein